MTNTSTSTFYKNLIPVYDFLSITNTQNYVAIPQDWYIIITDIINSTHAIEQGQYKDVNTVGVLAIIAVANALGHLDFPFVFGGDGSTLLLAGSTTNKVYDVLASVRIQAEKVFGLQLRVGIVPVSDVYESGKSIGVLKFQISRYAQQIMITGDGLEYAEMLIKNPYFAHRYSIPAGYIPKQDANFSGYECEFEEVESTKDEIISMIVQTTSSNPEGNHQTLKDILKMVESICGTEREHHPVALDRMVYSHSSAQAMRHVMVNYKQRGAAIRWLQVHLTLVRNIFYSFVPNFITDWFKERNLVDTDYRKYDGSLKMVLSCSKKSRESLDEYLETLYEQGKIDYGIHLSTKALITCYLQSYRCQIHFVDGSNGGYALAAKQLKQRRKNRS